MTKMTVSTEIDITFNARVMTHLSDLLMLN